MARTPHKSKIQFHLSIFTDYAQNFIVRMLKIQYRAFYLPIINRHALNYSLILWILLGIQHALIMDQVNFNL
jgi:hypothetical protein